MLIPQTGQGYKTRGFTMTQWHEKSKRKSTGGIRTSVNRATKRLHQKGGDFSGTTLDAQRNTVKVLSGRGNTHKSKAMHAHTVSVTDPKTGKTEKMTIIWVHENAANRLWVRRNILSKGTLIEVQDAQGNKHFASVTSRPGQSGIVNAVMAAAPEEKKKAGRGARARTARKARAPKSPVKTSDETAK
ncbi:MAG: hypothetical protein Q8P05_01125 [Candidatus Diapherotrites archaeon]|nr:hypothetical protein [Candidatus Diapherotrites archaeon]MDZ4256559.1 hypothetical protein [archaeon]